MFTLYFKKTHLYEDLNLWCADQYASLLFERSPVRIFTLYCCPKKSLGHDVNRVAGVNRVTLKQKPDMKIWNRLSQPIMSLNEGRLCINKGIFELYIEENCYPAYGGSMLLRNGRNNLQTRRCMTLLEVVGVARCSCVTHCSVYTEDPNPNLHCPQVSTAMLRPDSHCQLPEPTLTWSNIYWSDLDLRIWGFYAAKYGNSVPKFQNNPWAPSSRGKQPFFLECLGLEDRTDMLSRNVGTELPYIAA